MKARGERMWGPWMRGSSLAAAARAVLVGMTALMMGAANAPAADEPRSAADAPPANFLDPLLDEVWKEEDVKPPTPASDDGFLRRAYLDIIGRIPNVQEAQAFLASKDPNKRAKLVELLLDHVDYQKNFATIWTNLLIGRGDKGRRVDRMALNSWLRKQFGADRPWNDVVYDLITATGSNRENGAVNYTLAHLESEAVPLTSLTTRLFLGQQLQCTQCHDHPQNDWKQSDFWGMNAFFRGIKSEEKRAADATGLERYDHTELTDQPSDAFARFEKRNGMMGIAFPRFLDGEKLAPDSKLIRRVELGKRITDPDSELLAKAMANRMWAHFMGRGFVNPVDDIGPHNTPVAPEVFDALAEEFRESNFDVKQLIRWITTSKAYQATSLRVPAKGDSADEHEDDDLFNVMTLRPMTPEQLFDSLVTATSSHRAVAGSTRDDARRDTWMRQFLFVFGNDEDDETTTFQGTIPQSLMMMNGEMIRDAISEKPGGFLAEVVAQGRRSRSPANAMIDQIYLASLSRPPSAKERQTALQYLKTQPDSMRVLQDLFWALLNSNEFILIH